jgi:hypothetical protein
VAGHGIGIGAPQVMQRHREAVVVNQVVIGRVCPVS